MAYTFKQWTSEEEIQFTAMMDQGNLNYEQIGKLLGRTFLSCQNKAKKLGIKSKYRFKIYSHNPYFWKTLNPNNCYWAGFIAADGCIRLGKTQQESGLILQLGQKDELHLQNFVNAIKFNGPINHIQRLHIASQKTYSSVRVNIHSCNQLLYDLKQHFGIVYRKTYRLPPPKITDHYLQMCYLIGYLDGDGCISLHRNPKYPYLIFHIAGESYSMISWIANLLSSTFKHFKVCKNPRQSFVNQIKNCNCFQYVFSGKGAIALFSYLSQFPVPKLARKWQQPKVLDFVAQKTKEFPHLLDFSGLPNSWEEKQNPIVTLTLP